jgi:hypothetical protein
MTRSIVKPPQPVIPAKAGIQMTGRILRCEEWSREQTPPLRDACGGAGSMIRPTRLTAEKRFRRVRGHQLMPKLTAALGLDAIAENTQAA